MFSNLIIAVPIALFFTPAATIFAQEHPEHPKKSAEHPKEGAEHPNKGGGKNRSALPIFQSASGTISMQKTKRAPTENFTSDTKGKIWLWT